MSAADKAKDKAESAKGKAKEAIVRSIDDPVLTEEGKGDQVSGDLKQAGEKVKDAFKH
ncbi:MAG: CsbD family protein [Acidimicrobiales bacterium]|nr:CsbD family protein [Acidimicrobiales bacterium]